MREALPEEEEMDDVMYALWMVFGIRSFRGKQEEIVNSVLAGHDTFVLMPTGGGKSLCYQVNTVLGIMCLGTNEGVCFMCMQLPAVLSKGMTVVVSPLLSLVQDQVRTLVLLPSGGVPATYLSSHQTEIEKRNVYKCEGLWWITGCERLVYLLGRLRKERSSASCSMSRPSS